MTDGPDFSKLSPAQLESHLARVLTEEQRSFTKKELTALSAHRDVRARLSKLTARCAGYEHGNVPGGRC